MCIRDRENIIKRAPQVDLVFGPQTIHRVPKLYQNIAQEELSPVDITFPKTEKFEHLPQQESEGPTAFVSIMEGCNKYCSFCVVPHTRGHEISRPLEDILKEIKGLSSQGVKEINLLGQNVNSYRDSKLKTKGLGLSNLIRATAEIDGIERIQFTTSHPFEFGQDLIDIYNEVPELISYVHLPVQSGSNSILKQMRRRHTREEYFEIIEKLKNTFGLIDEMQDLDLSDLEPLNNPLELSNVSRKDTDKNRNNKKKFLDNSPESDEDYFNVPKIIE